MGASRSAYHNARLAAATRLLERAELPGEGDEGRVIDPDEIARVPVWKQQLQCSTLFSLSRRV